MKVAQLCPTFCRVHGLYGSWNSPGQNTGMGSLSFLQGIFPTQGSNPGILHCRWIFLPAEPQGKPKNTGVGNLSLLQWMFLTQGLNQGLLHCRWILYQLSYQGSPAVGKAAANASRSLIQPICKLPTINPIITLYGVACFTFWSQNFFSVQGILFNIPVLEKLYFAFNQHM